MWYLSYDSVKMKPFFYWDKQCQLAGAEELTVIKRPPSLTNGGGVSSGSAHGSYDQAETELGNM